MQKKLSKNYNLKDGQYCNQIEQIKPMVQSEKGNLNWFISINISKEGKERELIENLILIQ
ncbi:hypothetical protein TTHERM_00600220 (macronuclear) [Tetrahymena thermophila SB210]|uniref:Uncharacterized protein n=1 Tax=Tetrahymena thermophila (strain SB210) TaxID=312017 RepID=I7M6A1_TETTS|nr:hypothetical protein TTHERM_00600220 [Tetrahymena thermophila SB210]EAR84830.1 hypothetical protein TTHERM_00600220 [Tetrahymena thermophila SB210]|eukprot:XP_001032493.1 hypothetical protein TTHERM_00600220 [Tetrahymena thermophila SB210]